MRRRTMRLARPLWLPQASGLRSQHTIKPPTAAETEQLIRRAGWGRALKRGCWEGGAYVALSVQEEG